jgi:hypothetical protein
MQFKITPESGAAQAGAASRTKFKLPPGFRYDALMFTLVNVTANTSLATAYPDPFLLKSNNSPQREITVTRLDSLNALNNKPSATYGTAAAFDYTAIDNANPGPTQLIMPFHEPWGRYDPYHRFALDVLDGDNFVVECPSANVTTAPTVILTAIGEPLADVIARKEKLNRVIKDGNNRPTLVKYILGEETPSGTSYTITKWKNNLNPEDVVQHIRFYDPTGGQTIETLDFKVGSGTGKSWTDVLTKKQNGAWNRFFGGMNPGAGFFDLVPMITGAPSEGWMFGENETVQITQTYSAAASTPAAWLTQAFGPTV